jgi:hypothetical protein
LGYFVVTGTYSSGTTHFTVLASAPETYVIAPKLPKDSALQLYPVSKSVAVNELRCMVRALGVNAPLCCNLLSLTLRSPSLCILQDEVKFTARDSVYHTGHVTPAISGVEITVFDAETKEVIATGLTDGTSLERLCLEHYCSLCMYVSKIDIHYSVWQVSRGPAAR